MKKWDYTVVETTTSWPSTIQNMLQKYGNNGWELVSVIHCKSSDTCTAEYIFKKEKVEELEQGI